MVYNQQGLTRLETAVAVAIVIIILIIAFIAFDPFVTVRKSRNAERWTHVSTYMEAVQQFALDHKNNLAAPLDQLDDDAETVQYITTAPNAATCGGTCGEQVVSSTDCSVDISDLTDEYLEETPRDPNSEVGSAETGYYINVHNGVFTIGACHAEAERNGAVPDIRLSE